MENIQASAPRWNSHSIWEREKNNHVQAKDNEQLCIINWLREIHAHFEWLEKIYNNSFVLQMVGLYDVSWHNNEICDFDDDHPQS